LKSDRIRTFPVQRSGGTGTLLLVTLAIAMSSLISNNMLTIAQSIVNEFVVSDRQLTMAVNASRVLAPIFAIVAGIVAVWRVGIRAVLVATGIGISALALILIALAPTYLVVLGAQLASGAGYGITLAAGISLAVSCAGPRYVALAVATIGVGVTLVMFVWSELPGELVLLIGWRVTCIVMGSAAALIALLLLVFGRDRRIRRETGWIRGSRSRAFAVAVLMAMLTHVLLGQVQTTLEYIFYVEELGISRSELARHRETWVLAGAAGTLTAGLLAIGGGATPRWLAILFAMFTLLSVGPLVAIGLGADETPISYVTWFSLARFTDLAWYPLGYAALVVAMRPDRGAAIVAIAWALFSVSHFLVGPLMQILLSGDWAVRSSFLILGILKAVPIALLVVAAALAGAALPRFTGRADNPRTLSGDVHLLSLSDCTPEYEGTALKGFGISRGEQALVVLMAVVVAALLTGLMGLMGIWGIVQPIWRLPALLLTFIMLSIVGWIVYGIVAAQSKRRQQFELTQLDTAFVLYLRPFTFDLKSDVTSDSFGYKGPVAPGTPLEEALGAVCLDVGLGLKAVGPVEGQYGVDAVETDDARWREVVGDLMERADLIAMVPGGSEGATWEIRQLSAHPHLLEKTIWIMPPRTIAPGSVDLEREWDRIDPSAFQEPPPPYTPEGMLFAYRTAPSLEAGIEVRPFSFIKIAQAVGFAAQHPRPCTARMVV
jgi:hypothetical protein